MTQPQSPQPTPSQWGFGISDMSDGSKTVIVQIHLLTGTTVLFLSAHEAKGISAQMEQTASLAQAQSQLIKPVNVLLGANGQPLSFVPPAAREQDKPEQIEDEAPDAD